MDIVFKTELLKGAKGDAGDASNYEVPTGAIIAYDGEGIPNGYELTDPPDGYSAGSIFSLADIENRFLSNTTITAQGGITP